MFVFYLMGIWMMGRYEGAERGVIYSFSILKKQLCREEKSFQQSWEVQNGIPWRLDSSFNTSVSLPYFHDHGRKGKTFKQPPTFKNQPYRRCFSGLPSICKHRSGSFLEVDDHTDFHKQKLPSAVILGYGVYSKTLRCLFCIHIFYMKSASQVPSVRSKCLVI